MASCLKRTKAVIAICKAVISRSLFALHGFICIWRVTVVKGQPLFWSLTGTIPLIVLETILTLKHKKGGEWKWICPSVLLYLGTAVPAIWFLELDLMVARMTSPNQQLLVQRNFTDEENISVLNGKLRISLRREEWCKILEQMLLLILIIGRWLLPKGKITREQLSQLLLVYIGMAADIIELFEAFKEDGVRENYSLTLIILSLWTASLLQFSLVVTATKVKRMRPTLFRSGSSASTLSVDGKVCCPTEVVSILISVTLQDGPFLVLRMLLIFRYNVLSYTNLFFTSKNSLVLVLQFYRLFVLFGQKNTQPPVAAVVLTKGDYLDANERKRGGKREGTVKCRKRQDLGKVTFTDEELEDDASVSSANNEVHCKTVVAKKKELNIKYMSKDDGKTTSRRESFRRQQAASVQSPCTSTEHDGVVNTATAASNTSPSTSLSVRTSHSKRNMSQDSAHGSLGDSCKDSEHGSLGDSCKDSAHGSLSDSCEDIRNTRKKLKKWSP